MKDLRAILLCALFVLVGASLTTPSFAGDRKNDWVGKRVVLKSLDLVLTEDDRPVEKSRGKLRIYTVQSVKGDRLQLYFPGMEGWAKADDVVDVEHAIEHFTNVLKANPKDASAYAMRGMVWCGSSKVYDKALADFNKAIQLDPERCELILARGYALSDLKSFDRACEDFDLVIQWEPQNLDALLCRAQLWTEKQEYEKAIQDANAAIALDPNSEEAFHFRGVIWIFMEKFENAIADFDKAIKLDPKHAMNFTNRGLILMSRDKIEEAFVDFNEAIRLDPKCVMAFNNRGSVWATRKQYDKALADYNEAIRLDPKHLTSLGNRADIWIFKREYDEALEDRTALIRLDPKNPSRLEDRARAWLCKREFDRAIEDLSEAIGIDPKYESAFINRGCSELFLKEYEKAIADFDEAISLNAKDQQAWLDRSVAGFLAGRVDAPEDANMAIAYGNWNDETTIYAALMGYFSAMKSERLDDAKAFLEGAASKADHAQWPYPLISYLRGELNEKDLLATITDDDKMTIARCILGMSAEQNGHPDAAVAHYRWIKEHWMPFHVESCIALAALERLEKK